MSFIQIIRDFIEVINTSSGSGVAQLTPNYINFQKIIEIAFLFCLQNIKCIIFNFFSLEWLREVSQFQIFVPKVSESILRETFFLENYNPIYIFFDTDYLNTNKFFIGFLNGFFLSLPFSCSHFIFLRRLLVQGRLAGISAALGNICGQVFFIGSIILGVRVFIIPFFSFQPLVYISGTFLLITAIYNMVHEKSIKIIKQTDRKQILQIFLLNFFLIWSEQSCIYQFFTNISVGPEPTLLESFVAGFGAEMADSMAKESFETFYGFLFIHFLYLIGLFFGSIFFYCIIGFLLENGSEYILIRLKILKSSWVIGTNFVLLSSILTFTFTSIPYYTIDYLLTNQLGFISQDKAFKNTIFSQNNVIDSMGFLGAITLCTDIANFDRGFYLNKPGFESFEELNYSGEYATFIKQGFVNDEYKEKARRLTSSFTDTEETLAETKKEEKKLRRKGGSIRQRPNSDNIFEYPTYFLVNKNFSQHRFLERRFKNNYKRVSNTTFKVIFERTFNQFFSKTQIIFFNPEQDNKIKRNYYSNPVYKFLLNIDIDLFLKRQFHKINGEEEKELHEKRLLVTRYNDTLRFYNLLPYSEEFQFLFNGTKSFADRVYNQQFKGTLRIVRQLFSISFFSNPNTIDKGILKYDQPFFLNKSERLSEWEQKGGGHDFYHEELSLEGKQIKKKPFIEIMNQDPFYIGWDANLRKIIVTNRIVAKKTAIFENPGQPSLKKSVDADRIKNTENIGDKKEKMVFSAWPILKKNIKSKNKVLFTTKENITKKRKIFTAIFRYRDYENGISSYKTLPINLKNLGLYKFDIFPPNRGGFVWPGTKKAGSRL
jgi:hypothetical protein